jgi:hypothetical protein
LRASATKKAITYVQVMAVGTIDTIRAFMA